MRKTIYKHTLTLLFLFASIGVFSQKIFNGNYEQTSFTIEEKMVGGYKTTFDFTRDQVRKGWWKYAKSFGSPLDMRKYYKVIIPSENNEGNIDLVIYAVSTELENECSFFLGIEDKQYLEQAANLISDFKKQFYINHYLQAVKQKQEEAERLSNIYDAAKGRRQKKETLDALNLKRAEIDNLKEVISAIGEQ